MSQQSGDLYTSPVFGYLWAKPSEEAGLWLRHDKPGADHRANAEIVTPSPDLHHRPSAIHGGIFVAKR